MGFTSFSIALSALSAHTTAIDVVGNNLANLNTTGFKESTVAFHDLVTQSLGAGLGGTTQVGFGVGTPVTIREFTQGAIQSTSSPLDVAIQGDGFLIVHTTQGATQYTRGGNLVVDTSGNLTNATGDFIQGWGVPGRSGGHQCCRSATSRFPWERSRRRWPLRNVSVDLNLNAAATAGPPPDSFSTSMQVYDSLGNTHVVTFNFTKTTTANAWDYTMSFPPGDTTAPSTPVTGTLQFDGNGNLTSPLPTDPPIVLNVTGLKRRGFRYEHHLEPVQRNHAAHHAVHPAFRDLGPVAGRSRGGQSGKGRHFRRRQNCRPVFQWRPGHRGTVGHGHHPESGIPAGGRQQQLCAHRILRYTRPSACPNTGGRGQILGGSVEASTVDIAKEFTNLIVFQRGYEANARVVTTVDQLSQDTIALKPA